MLLQMGISLMQPLGFGGSGMGAIGQAIGSAGEFVDRNEAMDLKEDLADIKGVAEQRRASTEASRAQTRFYDAETRRQRANTYERNAGARGGLSLTARFNQRGRENRDFATFAQKAAKEATDPLNRASPYRGKRPEDLYRDPNWLEEQRRLYRTIRPSTENPTAMSNDDEVDVEGGAATIDPGGIAESNLAKARALLAKNPSLRPELERRLRAAGTDPRGL